MRMITALLAAAALLALAAGPASARSVKYVGKSTSGHKVTFTLKNGRIHDLTAGIRTSCLSIQGGGAPLGGPEIFGFTGSLPLKAHNRYTFEEKPSFHWREVTVNHDLWIKRRGTTIKGRMRQQYEFMISKFPIGTFSIYSCLGGAKFTAKAQR
jgi:hypothetical protein